MVKWTHVQPLIVGHLKHALCPFARIDQRLDFRKTVHARINDMVPGYPEPVVSKDPWFSEIIIRAFHALRYR